MNTLSVLVASLFILQISIASSFYDNPEQDQECPINQPPRDDSQPIPQEELDRLWGTDVNTYPSLSRQNMVK
jgi:hypothetical protein